MTQMCACISHRETNPWPRTFVELQFGMARAAVYGAHIVNGGASTALTALISSLASAGLNSKMTFRSCVMAVADFLNWFFGIVRFGITVPDYVPFFREPQRQVRSFLSTNCLCDVSCFDCLFPDGNGHCCSS
jgi:hypothetical protein